MGTSALPALPGAAVKLGGRDERRALFDEARALMKAMVYTAPLELKILEVDVPEPLEGEVLVRVRAAGICGSELEGVASRSPFRVPPLIMGHEFVGNRADNGDFVIVNPVVSCFNCDLCLRGLTNVCRHRVSWVFNGLEASPSSLPYPNRTATARWTTSRLTLRCLQSRSHVPCTRSVSCRSTIPSRYV